jgi:glutaredoxin
MTKEFLSRRGIPFEALDIENDPAAADALRALGFTSVPVVARGARAFAGWNPTKLAELLDIEHTERTAPADELIRSLDMILAAAIRAVRQVPDGRLTMRSPDRDRLLRQLAHHIFRVVDAGVDADILGRFPAGEWLAGGDMPQHTSAGRIARYGEAVRAKFQRWFSEIDPAAFDRPIEADIGERTVAQVLERTRSHAAQHLRQLYEFLRWCQVEPDRPLSADDLRGIDLPDAVW